MTSYTISSASSTKKDLAILYNSLETAGKPPADKETVNIASCCKMAVCVCVTV